MPGKNAFKPGEWKNIMCAEKRSLLDNYSPDAKLADYLRPHVAEAKILRLVSAYFSIYGFDALKDALKEGQDKHRQEVRLLFGSPESAADVASGQKIGRSFELTEDRLRIVKDRVLQQRWLAEECRQWLSSKYVQVRKVTDKNFLHGKMYHAESDSNQTYGNAATIGSSNFTRRGMGTSETPNIEINHAVNSPSERAECGRWFDNLWGNEERTGDAKKDVLKALERMYTENSPEFVYYKMLFEIFKERIDEIDENNKIMGKHLSKTEIWKALYDFQKEGASLVINRLNRLNGCILADSVGLGKTYTALAVIKYFESLNQKVIVMCPKRLEENWKLYLDAANDQNNPFPGDKFRYQLVAHTDLNRDRGKTGMGANLATFDWGIFDLVVIDESHNFRNGSSGRNKGRKSRYDKLLDEVIRRGGKTKVLMLSATPVNTSLFDLRSQVYLMTGKKDDAFFEALGIHSIRTVMNQAQERFRAWENNPGSKSKEDILGNLDGKFFKLWGEVSIARSRAHVEKFYSDGKRSSFPKRELTQNKSPDIDRESRISYSSLLSDIEKIQFYIHRPSDYVTSENAEKRLAAEKSAHNFNQRDREKYLIAMMHVNFAKRLESSACAFCKTLERAVGRIDLMCEKIDAHIKRQNNDTQIGEEMLEEIEHDHGDDEDFVVNSRAVKTYKLRELNVEKWRADIERDRRILQKILGKVGEIDVMRDGKIDALKEIIRLKATNDKNRKMLVFTAFKDTAKYLYENLKNFANDRNINVAFLSGDESQSTTGERKFSAILDKFSPGSRRFPGANETHSNTQIDLLIATDCISEGQNLQDCDTVLNYDIHWNPVRLIQRFGRIDRMESKNPSVRMINFWPVGDINKYLKLESRVRARMALVDATATGDDDLLNESNEAKMKEGVQQELNFRDNQLKQMRKEPINLEDMGDTVNMSDLTLDYFMSQLIKYLAANRQKLEAAPPGIHAVVESPEHRSGDPIFEAVFLFRHVLGNDAPSCGNNPAHPFYMVNVDSDGKIHYGYDQTRAILELCNKMASDKGEPLVELCDAFNDKIGTPEGENQFNNMAVGAISNIRDMFKSNASRTLGGSRSARIPREHDVPGIENLELASWFVVVTSQNQTVFSESES